GCRYCTQHHVAFSKNVGLNPDDWRALKEGYYSRFSEKHQAALAYAEKLTRTPQNVNDADFVALKTHFADAEIMDLHLLVGTANLTNRFPGPLGLQLEIPEQPV